MAHRRLSFDCKSRPVFSHQSAGIASQTRSSDDMEKVKSEIHEYNVQCCFKSILMLTCLFFFHRFLRY